MKKKIILFTILASLSVTAIPASAYAYSGQGISPADSSRRTAKSPVVLNYSKYNTADPRYIPQSYNQNYYNSFTPSTTVPMTPNSITSVDVSPETTNYGKDAGIKYDLNIGSIYGTAQERGNLVSSVENMPLNKIGIGRTVSDLMSLFTSDGDGSNSNYWSYDSNSNDNIIFRCGNYIVKFCSYKASYGIDVYAEVTSVGQTTYSLTEGEISNFFANLSNQLYLKEQKEKADKEAAEKADKAAQNTNVTYNNSVIINGNNSGSVVYNSNN